MRDRLRGSALRRAAFAIHLGGASSLPGVTRAWVVAALVLLWVRFGLIAAVVVPFFASGWRLTDLESEIPLRAALLGFFLRTLEVERLVAAFRVFGQVDVNLKYFSY